MQRPIEWMPNCWTELCHDCWQKELPAQPSAQLPLPCHEMPESHSFTLIHEVACWEHAAMATGCTISVQQC